MTVSRGLLGRAAVALSPVLLLLLLFRGTTAAAVQDLVYADEDLMKASPLTVAQCRAGCLHKLVPSDVEATECEKNSDCWKCWKYCEVLQTEGKNMKNICEHNCVIDYSLILSKSNLIKHEEVESSKIKNDTEKCEKWLYQLESTSTPLEEPFILKVHEPVLVQHHSIVQISSENDDEDVDDSDIDPTYSPTNHDVPDLNLDCNLNTESLETTTSPGRPDTVEANVENIENLPKFKSRKIRAERKLKRNSGKAYVTESGKEVPERKIVLLGNCRLKCAEKISQEHIQNLFTKYWQMHDRNRRASYLSGLINFQPKNTERKRRSTPEKQKKRSITYNYQIPLNDKLIKVCKACFLKIFGESLKFIWTICQQKTITGLNKTTPDKRGCHPPSNKKTPEDIKLVKRSLKSLPAYESHYCRKESSKLYLPYHFTLNKCYEMYSKNLISPVSRKLYEKMFHEANIKIKEPKKDTCNKCDVLKMQIQMQTDGPEKIVLLKEQEQHHKMAEMAYATKKLDKASMQIEDNKLVLSFDLQQCLPTPSLQNSIAFYKRQLWTYNLTIHNLKTDQATCYIWNESMAKRGANEIASCVYNYLMNLPAQITHVCLYSDSCSGQNKNSIFLAMCLYVLKKSPSLEVLEHKFLVPGHTRMECDSDHAQIEKKKKVYDAPIYHPHDWAQLIRLTGKKTPFEVIELKREDILDFASILKTAITGIQMKKINKNGHQIKWKDIKWFKYEKNMETTVMYKNSLEPDEEFYFIDMVKRGKHIENLTEFIVPICYSKPNNISKEKKKDLLSLLKYIPDLYHDFYKNLSCTNNIQDPLVQEESDED